MAAIDSFDRKLIAEAKRLGHHKTTKEAVTAALDEYIWRRKQARILRLFGTIDYDPRYDCKTARRFDRVENSK